MSRLLRVALTLVVAGLLAACVAPSPAPPAVAARPPEPEVRATASARPATSAPPAEVSESPLSGRRFSLMTPKLELPPLPDPPGQGGTRPEGAGESGTVRDSQIAVPFNTANPRYAPYFAELKQRIEEKWGYPPEAALQGQSGQGELRFILRRDGSVSTVEILKSSGIPLLDHYIERAIRLAQPFPPIPTSVGKDMIPISVNFNYMLRRPQ